MVFQFQLGRQRDAVPLTRDYIADEEARLAAREPAVIERLLASTATALDGDSDPFEEQPVPRAAE